MNTKAFAAINTNNAVRLKSSSGAVFYELARYVIQNGGFVYGAKFDERWSITHSHTDLIDEIDDFLGSKYAQSDLCNEYKDIESKLNTEQLVLFSGSPCQVEGLKCFLGKDYSNLITVDFICHGVPSPLVWQEYILMLSKGQKITNINFRDKTEGWRNYSLNIEFESGGSYRETVKKDLYIQGFIQNIYLRPSCYQCQFKKIERNSDITLADFWGVDKVLPEMFDDKGTSLILIHSGTGENLWENVKSGFRVCEIEIEDIAKYNPAAVTSAERNIKRENFYLAGEDKFHELEQILRKPINKRAVSQIKHVFKKILDK